jgi:hypothetical protein
VQTGGHLRQHISFFHIRGGKGVATDDAFETDQNKTFKAIIFLIFRRSIAEFCFTLKATTAGCSSILASENRQPSGSYPYAPLFAKRCDPVCAFSDPINWGFAWQN